MKRPKRDLQDYLHAAYRSPEQKNIIPSKDPRETFKRFLDKQKQQKIEGETPMTNNLESIVDRLPPTTQVTRKLPKYPDRIEVNYLGDNMQTYVIRLYVVRDTATPQLQNINVQETLQRNTAQGIYSLFIIEEPKNPRAPTSLQKFYDAKNQEKQFSSRDKEQRLDLTTDEFIATSKLSDKEYVLQTLKNGVLNYRLLTPSIDRDNEIQYHRPTYTITPLTRQTRKSPLEIILPTDSSTPALVVPLNASKEGQTYIAQWKQQLANKYNTEPIQSSHNTEKEIFYDTARHEQERAIQLQDKELYTRMAEITGMTDELDYFI